MSVIDDYFAKLTTPEREALERVRRIVLATAPTATEVITYGMPGFKYQGKYLIAFCQFRDHLSVFPGSGAIAELAEQLKDYKQSKGTIQFTLDHPLPDSIIQQMVQSRVTAIGQAA